LPANSDASVFTANVVPVEEEDERLKIATYPTLMDVLIYLMDHYNVELSTKKDMYFAYVTPKNPYYAQFRTAYEYRLI